MPTAPAAKKRPGRPRIGEEVPPDVDGYELPSGLDTPTLARRKMQQAEAQQDFARACQLVRHQAQSVVRETRKQMQATGTHACPEFWEAVATQSKQALILYQQYQDAPLSVLLDRLRADGLYEYADALTGAMAWTELVF